ncbi:MAG: hypothetical protein Q8L48_09800 [Archangium sp.]|nr:hypothetical protein [Archangium sp.]
MRARLFLLFAALLSSLNAGAERLLVCGWELQSLRAGVETDPGVSADGGTSLDAVTIHGGAVAARATAIAGRRSSFRHFFVSATPAMYARVYVRLEQPVNATTMFLLVRRSGAVPAIAWLTVDPAGVVRPQVWVSAWPATAQLTVGQWHRFDIFVDERGGMGAHTVQIALDGVTFVLAQGLTLSHIVDTIEVGLNVNQESASAGVMLFDDIAVNGTAGTAENGFPEPGRVFLMRPDGPGAAAWTPTDGGLASPDNWLSVSELPPDDAVTALESATNASAADEYDVEPPPAEAMTSAVSLVMVGARFNGTGTTNRSLGVSVRSSAAGAQALSPGLAANVVGWYTNRSDGYLNVPLAASRTPEGAPWTAASLDTMRIGVFDADSVARPVQATSVFAMVELASPLEPPPPLVGVIADAGVPDAGPADAGRPDAGTPDAGTPDAGEVPDGGTTDAGPASDGGLPMTDAGVSDGGPSFDGGEVGSDAGEPADGGVRGPLHLTVGCACDAAPGSGWLLALLWALRRKR